MKQKSGFREVKAEILKRIRGGVWPPGHLLPAETELAAEFGFARATVNRAMRELCDEGIVDRKRRAGTRVNASPARHAKFEIPIVRHEIEATGARYRYALISSAKAVIPDWLRARLELATGTQVRHLQCLHFADNSPFQFEDRWINLDAVPAAAQADFNRVGPNEWLVDQVPFTQGIISFSAASVSRELADYLSAAPGEPVFVAERTTWLNHQPVTHARMSFHSGYRMTTRF